MIYLLSVGLFLCFYLFYEGTKVIDDLRFRIAALERDKAYQATLISELRSTIGVQMEAIDSIKVLLDL